MSVSPSYPPGPPSLGDIIIRRAFSRPPRPFVDAEIIEALEQTGPSVAPKAPPATPVYSAGRAAGATSQGAAGAPIVSRAAAPGAGSASFDVTI